MTESIKSKASSVPDPTLNEDMEKDTTPVAIADIRDTVDTDPYIVFWDTPSDPANPLNWSITKKSINITILSAMTFLTPLASSMFAPGVPDVMREFDTKSLVRQSQSMSIVADVHPSDLLATFVVSVFILGWACGPLVRLSNQHFQALLT